MLDRIDEITPVLGPGQNAGTVSPSARWTARKKVDIRYHELSEDSYFAKLRCLAPEVCSVDRIGVDHALRLPPAGSPALRRGQLIREFSGGALDVSVDWSHVVIGSGKDRRIVSVG
jgi:proteasome accessory factor A